ncbi:COP23 domain-containing protein [Leptolyngbya iicbica]|uniref:Circadian oscillating protein COP23 n=2 Tax=Cyanophyceae TaxID=3028117 RepID=A0A4Q7E525_9CYAN|nr:COP23 domain-containing protein [Leptolyngbya sp. LK]RZM77403.1 hypothetical protein DYY88_17375 [Leptolyngbya sp. LK]
MTTQWTRWVSTGLTVGLLAASVALPVSAQVTDPAEDSTPEAEAETTNDEVALPDEEVRFSCETQNGRPTVMYVPVSQPGNLYAWATPEDMGAAWPAERRCTEIARRLEMYRPDGLLELQTGRENGYNTVCVTTEADASCRIVFTVPEGQDPVATRDRVFDNLVLADQGQATEGVTTFAEGDSLLDEIGNVLGFPTGGASSVTGSGGINLQPFLDSADGGTGAQLNQNSGGRRLNPNNF